MAKLTLLYGSSAIEEIDRLSKIEFNKIISDGYSLDCKDMLFIKLAHLTYKEDNLSMVGKVPNIINDDKLFKYLSLSLLHPIDIMKYDDRLLDMNLYTTEVLTIILDYISTKDFQRGHNNVHIPIAIFIVDKDKSKNHGTLGYATIHNDRSYDIKLPIPDKSGNEVYVDLDTFKKYYNKSILTFKFLIRYE